VQVFSSLCCLRLTPYAPQCKGLEFEDVFISPSLHEYTPTSNLLHVALTRASGTVEITEELLKMMAPSIPLHKFVYPFLFDLPILLCRFLTLLPSRSFHVLPSDPSQPHLCPTCNTLYPRQLAYQPSFPFHPSHNPPPPLRPNEVDDPDKLDIGALLSRAEDIYAAIKPSSFPLCTSCAVRKATHEPLRATAEYATGASRTLRELETVEEEEQISFEGFVDETAEREEALRKAAEEDVERERF
jgi:hypothetical protein